MLQRMMRVQLFEGIGINLCSREVDYRRDNGCDDDPR